jgi:hypothetical protein
VSAEPSPAPVWSISFPFSASQENLVNQQLAMMPVRPTSITVGPNGILTQLDVEVPNRATAYDDLVAAISAAGTGPGRRLMLRWHYPVTDKRLTAGAGAVHVRGCEYPQSRFEQMPAEYLSVDELRLQERLRQEFDTCPR